MPFKPGISGNPAGRPAGIVSGRMRVIQILDDILRENEDVMRQALQAEMRKNPPRFFRTFVMPLLPKEAVLSIQKEVGPVRWTSLLEAYPLTDADTPAIDVAADPVPSAR